MKFCYLIFLTLALLPLSSCHDRERYGARMSIDAETGLVTPLNQEACYFLAYEKLAKGKTTEAQNYLKELETLPKPRKEKVILEEGVKTLWALSYLQDKKYEDAAVFMRQLKVVPAIAFDQDEAKDEFNYNQLRRIRSASIQLRNSLPALEKYFTWKKNNALNQTFYDNLKLNWRVELQYQKYSSIRQISFAFPPFE